MSSGLGQEIYTGAAEIGKIRVTISLIISIIIGIFLLVLGIIMICKKNVHIEQITANVDIANCTAYQQNYNCNLIISYEYNGKIFSKKPLRTTNSSNFVVNDKIDIYINPQNPSDYSLESLAKDKMIGWFMIGISFIVVALAVLFYWLTYKSKFFAATEGVGLGVQMLSGGSFGY